MTSRCTVYLFRLGGWVSFSRKASGKVSYEDPPASSINPARKERRSARWMMAWWAVAKLCGMRSPRRRTNNPWSVTNATTKNSKGGWIPRDWNIFLDEILTSEASAGPLSWKIAGKVLVNLGGWFTMVTMSTPTSNKQIFVGQLFRFQTKILHHSYTQSTSHIVKPPLLPPPFRGRKWVPVPGIILCSHPQYQLLCHRCHARYTLPRLCRCGECRLASGMDGTLVKFWWHGVMMGLISFLA